MWLDVGTFKTFLKILIKEFYFDIIEGVNNYSVGNKMDLNGYRLILLNKNSLGCQDSTSSSKTQ